MVREQLPHHPSQWADISAMAPKLGCTDRLAALERENRELKRANDALRKANVFFAAAGCPLLELDRLTR